MARQLRARAEQLQQEADEIATRYDGSASRVQLPRREADPSYRGYRTKDAIVSSAKRSKQPNRVGAPQIEEQVASERVTDERVDELAGLVVRVMVERVMINRLATLIVWYSSLRGIALAAAAKQRRVGTPGPQTSITSSVSLSS